MQKCRVLVSLYVKCQTHLNCTNSRHLLTGSKTWLFWSGRVVLHSSVANDDQAGDGANHLAQRILNSIHSFVILAQLFLYSYRSGYKLSNDFICLLLSLYIVKMTLVSVYS